MLGEGAYRLSEAARYAGVPLATVRSWFKVRSDGLGRGPVFKSDFPMIEGDYAVSFLNLIEIYVARFFRNEGVKPPVLRRAHEILQAELGTTHPFAHASLGTDGRRIIQRMEETSLVDAVSKQHFFGQMYLDKIMYSPATRLAEAWEIADGVTINPSVSFGKPVIEHTGVTTFVVANQFKANRGNAELVASLFDLLEADVLHAVHFENGLKRRAA
jgi:uncharacterized protein (DUF433 family)